MPLKSVRETDAFRIEFNTIRPHEALDWNRPAEVHQDLASPTIPILSRARNPANYLARANRSLVSSGGSNE